VQNGFCEENGGYPKNRDTIKSFPIESNLLLWKKQVNTMGCFPIYDTKSNADFQRKKAVLPIPLKLELPEVLLLRMRREWCPSGAIFAHHYYFWALSTAFINRIFSFRTTTLLIKERLQGDFLESVPMNNDFRGSTFFDGHTLPVYLLSPKN